MVKHIPIVIFSGLIADDGDNTVVLVDETADYGQRCNSDLQSSLHDLATTADDLIAANAELHDRRRETQVLRDLLIVTLARCCPALSPDEILAVAQQVTERAAP